MAGIGKLRHRVVIQAENATPDGAGGFSDPWASPTVVATVWASVVPLSGSEQFRGMQLEDKITHKITMRYRAGVTAKNRIVFGTRPFNIRVVRNIDERDRWLELMCEEGVAV